MTVQKKHTALITGASSGLGLEFAKLYAREGYDLVIVARSEGKLYKLKNELEQKYHNTVSVCAQDLSVQDAAYKVFNYTLEHEIIVHTLINNAGFGDFGNFWEVDPTKQNNLLQVNIVALTQLTRCFLPGMVERKEGKILNISSVAAFMAGPRMSLYYASKAYVRSFSEAIAEEVKGTGVTVTALCPGPTITGFEKAAEMKNSHMFTLLKTSKATDVAQAGYKAVCKGKTLRYYGFNTNAMNVASRLMPRSLTRKFARMING